MENQPNFEIQEESGGQIAEILRGLGDEHGFDSETCDELADLPFADAFETAYGYLAQAGLDPDEVLSSFLEEPEDFES